MRMKMTCSWSNAKIVLVAKGLFCSAMGKTVKRSATALLKSKCIINSSF